jgi:hypothetical protein
VKRKSPRFIYVRGALGSFHTAWALTGGSLRCRNMSGVRGIVLQSRFARTGDEKFCGSRVRFSCKNAGDLIASR